MNDTKDLFLQKDILPLFDHTLNPDSQYVLLQLLQKPLQSLEQIKQRQAILKQIIATESLWMTYDYNKIDYVDSQKFLSYFPLEKIKNVDFVSYILKKQIKNMLLGEYMQLIHFLLKIEGYIANGIVIENFPEDYQPEISYIIDYLRKFRLKHYTIKIRRGKFGYYAVQELNAIVSENRRNGSTLLFFEKLNLLECYISISKGIAQNKFQFADIGNDCIQLLGIYHPLVADPIKNDIEVTDICTLVTGANMSGKSTLLKTIGLCIYLSHLGVGIPATSAKIPFYDTISIQINHSDDLKNGYSHFMNEIVNLKKVIQEAHQGKRCFAIFDELFKGTNHQDALTISVKTMVGLKKFKTCNFFISTHLNELREKLSEYKIPTATYYLDCEIQDETPIFNYLVKAGWSTLQIGQLLFKKEGLDELLG